MKYVELKTKLKSGTDNNYLIYGEDRFLCFDALKKIEDSLCINFKDLNKCILSNDNVSVDDLITSASIFPFCDEYRLVIAKNVALKNKDDIKKLENYLENPLKSTILVLFCIDNASKLETNKNLTVIDCNKIDEKYIFAFVKNRLTSQNIAFDEDAIALLVEFCNRDMLKVNNELEIICAYLGTDKKFDKSVVEEFIVPDKDYQVFELAEFIAKGDTKNAIALIDKFSLKSGSAFSIISPLYNNYRRALFVALNKKNKSVSELANLLGIKEFAVRSLDKQIAVFSVKKLKDIVDLIAGFDEKIKFGKMKESVAIKTLVLSIINLREQNE